jgi:apolipoprotein D and lipocalin family protein
MGPVAAMPVGVALSAAAPLSVVKNLDPARYVGTWYEIARFPNRFQDKCVGNVTATYTAAAMAV